MALSSVEAGIEAIARGEMIILVDDEDRENEGDLVIAAEKCTPEAINFMAKHGRGLICLSLTDEQLKKLELPMMVENNSSPFETAFTVSIEARTGVTTGISAQDRARTIQVAIADHASPEDIVVPGHVFPLRARPGGVLVRTGQTEGSVDFSRLAGLRPSAVICEILNEDGTMARLPDLERFAAEHNLLVCSIADLIDYRFKRDKLVELLTETPFPCAYGDDFRLRVYRGVVDGAEHLVLINGDPAKASGPVPVRVQHECLIGDVFRGRDCDCGWQLHGSLEAIAKAGVGVVVYLGGSELGRYDAVRRYALKEKDPRPRQRSTSEVKPEFRDLGIGCQILADCGVTKLKVLSNSIQKLVGLDAYGLELCGIQDIIRPDWAAPKS
ncbi:MAG: 3,4-dihydroxy-2-butanone-4-phosphate synthase [Polyangiaceae bacterium]